MSEIDDNNETNTLQVVLEHAGDRVAVHWSALNENRRWDPYFISERELNRLAKDIREKLSDLQGCDWSGFDDWDDAMRLQRYGTILQELSHVGEDLYHVLLTGYRRDLQSEQDADKFRGWFEKTVTPREQRGKWRIQVIHTNVAKATVPWGLVFTPRAESPSAESQPVGCSYDDYYDFWCSSFQLACRGAFLAEVDELDQQRDGREAKIALVIERDEYDVDSFEHVGKEHPMSDAYLKRKDYIAHDKREYQRHVRDQVSRDAFWYISLRASGGSYTLGGQTLGYRDALRETNADQIILMLIDGDAVIRNDRGPEWVKACLDVGPAGLIAAETDIQNPQLQFFGWKLFKAILSPPVSSKNLPENISSSDRASSQPLIKAMEYAREALWPRTLLYGVYCNPLHVYLSPAPTDRFAFIDDLLTLYRQRAPVENSDSDVNSRRNR